MTQATTHHIVAGHATDASIPGPQHRHPATLVTHDIPDEKESSTRLRVSLQLHYLHRYPQIRERGAHRIDARADEEADDERLHVTSPIGTPKPANEKSEKYHKGQCPIRNQQVREGSYGGHGKAKHRKSDTSDRPAALSRCRPRPRGVFAGGLR